MCLVLSGLALIAAAQTVDWRVEVGYLAAISAATVVLYRSDKLRAQAGQWRISESTLHLTELLGGWPAAYLAQRILPHKTSKPGYMGVFWCIVILHQLIAIDFLLGWPGSQFLVTQLSGEASS